MRKSGHSAGSSEGFTLLEVIVAAAILASSAAALVAIFVRATERASAARDITAAAAAARNTLEEGLAAAIETAVEGEVPQRGRLWLAYSEWPTSDGELPMSDSLFVDVTRDGAPMISLATRRALYISELEDGEDQEENEEGADEGGGQ